MRQTARLEIRERRGVGVGFKSIFIGSNGEVLRVSIFYWRQRGFGDSLYRQALAKSGGYLRVQIGMQPIDLAPSHSDEMDAVIHVLGAVYWFRCVGPLDRYYGVPWPARTDDGMDRKAEFGREHMEALKPATHRRNAMPRSAQSVAATERVRYVWGYTG
jgi:hypothetical protein